MIALSAISMFACAFGSGFLHASLGCSHDASADTVEHQEDDTAHWAALETEIFENSDCPVCITCAGFGLDLADNEAQSAPVVTSFVQDKPVELIYARLEACEIPRAPPI